MNVQPIRNTEKEINPDHAYFINLGERNSWWPECKENGIIKLGFDSAEQFDLYQKGNWDDVLEHIKRYYSNTSDTLRQIKTFFEADEKILWIAFQDGCLYWCISQPGAQKGKGGAFLKTVNGWCNTDIKGKTLTLDKLAGTLLKTRGYQGTICSVGAFHYLTNKINGNQNKNVTNVEKARKTLITSLELLIQELEPKDFELFVDLVLSRSGWQRITPVGGTQKGFDIKFLMPVTGESAFVQIKSSADQNILSACKKEFKPDKEARASDKMFFIYHTGPEIRDEDENVTIINGNQLAEWCMDSGLVTWLVEKAS